MAVILDGKKLSEKILKDLKGEIKKSGKKLKLAAVLVGDDKNSKIFLRQKKKACQKLGIGFQLFWFPKNISRKVLEGKVKKIGSQKNNGIIIQLPLPEHIDTQKILNLIPPKKDVDLLSEKSRGFKILPPVLAGILELFREYKIKIKGKKAAIIGRGRLVGKPVADWMEKHGADITDNTKEADILISGVGQPDLIKGNMIKRGAVVVDAAGDVEQKSIAKKASYFTPIPGGVGPMTVAMVLKNLFLLNEG